MVQSLAPDDHGIAKMAQQVKDVLPHVPLSVIAKDLGRPPPPPTTSLTARHSGPLCHVLTVVSWLRTAKTNCVDTTITNLLENREDAPMEATGMSTFEPSKSSPYSSGSAPTIKVRPSKPPRINSDDSLRRISVSSSFRKEV